MIKNMKNRGGAHLGLRKDPSNLIG